MFKVIAEAKYEYEVEADDDELAITKALELFDESYGHFQDPASVLEWRAIKQEEGGVNETIRGEMRIQTD